MSPSTEAGAVADLGLDSSLRAQTDPGHGREQLIERVGEEGFLDLRGDCIAAGEEPVELDGEFRNHPADGGLGWDRHRRGSMAAMTASTCLAAKWEQALISG